jgi:predicted CoA-binding protein
MSERAQIDRFLRGRRIAFVGISHRPEDFSHVVFRDLARRGYDLVPVRPGGAEIEGAPSYARVQDVPGRLDGAFLMTAPEVTEQIVRDCHAAGIRRVWMHRGFAGPGAVSAEAVAYCEARGIEVIAGECPLMFLPGAEVPHRMHAAMRRAAGHYPTSQPTAETPLRRIGALAAAGVAAWALCAAAMVGLLSATSTTAALWLHAAAAPLIFGTVAVVYTRWRGNAAPVIAASVITGIVLVLDAVVVAGLIQRSPALLASPLGLWLPLALGFAAVLFVATHRVPRLAVAALPAG